MAEILRCLAPAKLNLFLHITDRRSDGYHCLQTIFQFIDLCDELVFTLRQDNNIIRTEGDASIPSEQDLTLRAARLLQQTAGISQGVDVAITKQIPMGGGLGGGSSNAAAALLLLNRLWGCDLSTAELADLGLQLGADVPVFVHGQTAWAEGVGEKLMPVELPENWFLVLVPEIHVSTAEIFSHSDLTRNTHPITIRDLGERGNTLAQGIVERCHNDCEPIARQQYPIIADALDWLSQYAQARLTGTGACLFGRFASQQQALEVLAQFEQAALPQTRAFVAQGLNQSPVYRSL